MTDPKNPVQIIPSPSRLLTAADFLRLSDVPPEVEWFANLTNRCTRRAYENAIKDFMAFTGIVQANEFRVVKSSAIMRCQYPMEIKKNTLSQRLFL
ncbi:hypothetical protein [Methylomicrobium album]|uniref:Core-binding (CB) domain-containing protein n=1 Tax=Methylomicrobium album BG8 TaxID=686340 RepID=H8GRL4_METAL|nr:hypothetical protein [Methylomicrobium album]EIC27856.1 hypothetical protein Metal_4026 [Methylomicrobium album BG8]